MKYFVMFRNTREDGVDTYFTMMMEIGSVEAAVYDHYDQAHMEAVSRTRRHTNIIGYKVHTL